MTIKYEKRESWRGQGYYYVVVSGGGLEDDASPELVSKVINEIQRVSNENGAFCHVSGEHMSAEKVIEALEEYLAEAAEDLEIVVSYQKEGRERRYTPQAHWEPSGCEWEESAQYGYDYGWDI